MGRGGGGCYYTACLFIFLVLSNFHFQKGVQVIIGLKLKIRIMSSVTMLKHNIIYKWCLVKYNKSCLKCLKLSAQIYITQKQNNIAILYKIFIQRNLKIIIFVAIYKSILSNVYKLLDLLLKLFLFKKTYWLILKFLLTTYFRI